MLAYILELNLLSCSETVIFEACMSWIKAQSKQNEVTKQLIEEYLGELFYKIRFPSMTMQDFDALSTAHEYAFSYAEYKDVMHTFASSDASSNLFNGISRQMRWKDDAIVSCERKMNSFVLTCGMSRNKATKFESNQLILLGSLVFAPVSIRHNGKMKI